MLWKLRDKRSPLKASFFLRFSAADSFTIGLTSTVKELSA